MHLSSARDLMTDQLELRDFSSSETNTHTHIHICTLCHMMSKLTIQCDTYSTCHMGCKHLSGLSDKTLVSHATITKRYIYMYMYNGCICKLYRLCVQGYAHN